MSGRSGGSGRHKKQGKSRRRKGAQRQLQDAAPELQHDTQAFAKVIALCGNNLVRVRVPAPAAATATVVTQDAPPPQRQEQKQTQNNQQQHYTNDRIHHATQQDLKQQQQQQQKEPEENAAAVTATAAAVVSAPLNMDDDTFLCLLPARFRKQIWIKRDSFLIIEREAKLCGRGLQVEGLINHILFPDTVKEYVQRGIWPTHDPHFNVDKQGRPAAVARPHNEEQHHHQQKQAGDAVGTSIAKATATTSATAEVASTTATQHEIQPAHDAHNEAGELLETEIGGYGRMNRSLRVAASSSESSSSSDEE